MVEAAFEVEGAVVRGPGLDDQVVRLPQALAAAKGGDVGRRGLVGHAAHEAALEPAVGEQVDHRHFFGDAHRLVAVGDRVAEHQQSRLLGHAREGAEHHRRRGNHAGGGLVMFVEHDFQPEFVSLAPQVEVQAVELGALFRVEIAAGEIDPDRLVACGVGQVGVGILGEEPGFHCLLPVCVANANTFSTNASGCSTCGEWPALSITCSVEPGMSLLKARP